MPKGIYPGNKGRITSQETKNKIREATLRNGNKPPSWKGKKHSQEAKDKIRDAQKKVVHLTGEKSRHWKGGKPKCLTCGKQLTNYGKKHCFEHRDFSGENNPAWKGGINRVIARRARLKNAEGNHTNGQWENLKAQYNWTCPACHKKEPEIKLSEDHIVPLSLGGSNNIENIQPLCVNCNCRKHTKIIKYSDGCSD